MKKTLLVTMDFIPNTGGVANYYKNLVLGFPKDKIVVLADREKSDINFDLGVKFVGKPFLSKFSIWPKWLVLIWHIWFVCRQNKIRHIYVGQVLPVGTAVWIVHKLSGISYTVFVHGMDVSLPLVDKRKLKLVDKIIKDSQKVVANSRFTAGLVKKYSPRYADKTIILNPGVELQDDVKKEDVTFFKIKHGLVGKKVILGLGRLVRRKGFARLIDVFPAVKKKFPDLVLIIAGDGPEKNNLINLAGQSGQGKDILFFSKVDDSFKKILFKTCDIFVMPCYQEENNDVEGFGIVFLEAAVFGKPVIAGRSGGAGEAVVDGESGYLVDTHDNNDLQTKILRLFQNPLLRQKLGGYGQRRVKKFCWSRLIKDFLNINQYLVR